MHTAGLAEGKDINKTIAMDDIPDGERARVVNLSAELSFDEESKETDARSRYGP
jgi:hypothetical protein